MREAASMIEQHRLDAKALLLGLLHESYDKFAWHGPNLTQALHGVDVRQANWRPPSTGGTAVWNIHEIVRHVGRVMQRCGADLLDGSDSSTGDGDVEGDERTFPHPELRTDAEWMREVDLLHDSFAMVLKGVSETTVTRLFDVSPSRAYKKRWTFQNYIYGVAFHNVYHAAQIVSLRKRQGTWAEWQP
jgi:hypothetical protein